MLQWIVKFKLIINSKETLRWEVAAIIPKAINLRTIRVKIMRKAKRKITRAVKQLQKEEKRGRFN